MSSGLHVFPSVTDAEIQLSTILPLVCRPQVPVLICTGLGAFGSLVVGFFVRVCFAVLSADLVRRDMSCPDPRRGLDLPICQHVIQLESCSSDDQMNLATSWKLPQIIHSANLSMKLVKNVVCNRRVLCYNSYLHQQLSVIMSHDNHS